jgi:hypothetical protein
VFAGALAAGANLRQQFREYLAGDDRDEIFDAEQEPAYEPSYRRGYSYYGEGGPRWRHRHWHDKGLLGHGDGGPHIPEHDRR